MANLGFGSGPGEDIVIFRTTDGGATWTIASSTNSRGESMPGALPYAGKKTGLSFLDASTGWITVDDGPSHIPWLYVSHDGGRTWQQQSLQLPPNQAPTRLGLAPPTFFNATDGVLPVYSVFIGGCHPDNVDNEQCWGSDIYVTHDGGRTWHSTTLWLAGIRGFRRSQPRMGSQSDRPLHDQRCGATLDKDQSHWSRPRYTS